MGGVGLAPADTHRFKTPTALGRAGTVEGRRAGA